ncbi:MAG: chemotaxis protein CheB [Bryobacteraceae bacterium]
MAKKIAAGKRSPAVETTPPAHPSPASGPVPVVGIGASAGGLEAFTELLKALPDNTGMAFVLVSHLSRTHGSMLRELLSKTTRMPVEEVRTQTPVRANHVYVIPPSAMLALQDGDLTALPLRTTNRPVMVIDAFFRSLAEHRGSQAIGVVLSGTGSDGTQGLAAIKADGGIAFAQDEKSAKFPDMPRNASAQFGSADFVLPPAEISNELARIAGHPYIRQPKPDEEAEPATPETELAKILSLIKVATGVDYAQYKPTTIRRRISRRMVLHKIETIGAYLKRLESDPSEVEALYQDLLINVTCFFRDPEVWQFLKDQIFPSILKNRKTDAPIRIWVPGCATGEEPYSIAMLLLECKEPSGGAPIQIFATDISKQAIQTARDGIYRENIVSDVSPERLRRFFVKTNDGYQISKRVRDLCIFAVQDVTKDPPFSKLDLISCRNLLIYLGTPVQKRVLATFHYALAPAGYLLLGISETVGASSDLYRPADKKCKLYSKIATAARPAFHLAPSEIADGTALPRQPAAPARSATDLGKEADRVVLNKYSPPGVLINSLFDIIQFRGRTGPFLEPSPGQATLNLLKMAREGLVIDLRAAVYQAKKTGAAVRKTGVRLRSEGRVTEVNLEVTPIVDPSGREPCYLVLFQTVERPTPPQKPPLGAGRAKKRKLSNSEHELEALRGELAATQEDLRSIIEEQEATNEELQSANEEILSSNEELQSTNEELETAKEELQATNEELTTVNEELHNWNAELAKVNGDLTNLIESVDVVYVVLDSDLRIRRFTPAAQKVLNLIPTDIGRPIGDIKPNLEVEDLSELIQDVIVKMKHREQDVRDVSGRWYSLRIRPYKTQDSRIDGAILALTDIDALRRVQDIASGMEASLRALIRQPPDLLLAASPEGHVLLANGSAAAGAPTRHSSIFEFLEPDDRERLRQCLQKVSQTRLEAKVQVRNFALCGRNGPAILTIEPVISGEGVIAFSVRSRDSAGQAKVN